MQNLQTITRKLIFLFFVLQVPVAMAQDTQREVEELYDELDSLFADDPLPANLFQLVDSILAIENGKISAFNVRAGYVSEIQSAGRVFGINEFGYTGSLTYFHHTGFNAGVTGYGNSDYTPQYYMTDLFLGYMKTFKKNLTIQLNHDFYFYNDTLAYHPFDKSAQASVIYQYKFLESGVDYALLYGDSESSRITAHLNGRIKFSFSKGIDAITLMPGCSFQWGNADIFYWRQPRAGLRDLYNMIKQNDYPRLGLGDYRRLVYLLETNREQAVRFFLRQRDYTPEQTDALMDQYYDGAIITENSFGFMNWNVSLPVLIRKGRFSLLLNYTYNLPQPLPGETTTYPASGFFSTSLSYMYAWLKK